MRLLPAVPRWLAGRRQATGASTELPGPGAGDAFQRLVEEIPLITYVQETWPDGTRYYISPHIEAVLGVTAEAYNAMSWDEFYELVHPDDVERLRAENRSFNEAGKPLTSEYRMIARDGRIVWIRDVAVESRRGHGAVQRVRGYMLDITDQRGAEAARAASESLTRRVLASAQEGVVVVDREHRYVHWNPFMEQLRGMTEEEVLGRRPEELFSDLEAIGMG